MPKLTIRKPHCSECEKYFVYQDRFPKKQHGVTMNQFERFCLFGKKARRFKKSDAKIGIPSWCPKRIFPHIVRVYGFKDFLDEMLFMDLAREMKNYIPSEFSYILRDTGKTELSAAEYYEAGVFQEGLTPLTYEIVEIDDGVKSAFFFRTGDKLRYLPFFDKAKIYRGGPDAGE